VLLYSFPRKYGIVNAYKGYGVGDIFLGFREPSELAIFIVEVLLRDKKRNAATSTVVRSNKTTFFSAWILL